MRVQTFHPLLCKYSSHLHTTFWGMGDIGQEKNVCMVSFVSMHLSKCMQLGKLKITFQAPKRIRRGFKNLKIIFRIPCGSKFG